MALRDIGGWLLEVPGFRTRADSVVIDAACGELELGYPLHGPRLVDVTRRPQTAAHG